jgi:ribonuclease HI
MSKTVIKKGDTLKIYTDGAARGNPGPAAISFLYLYTNNIIHKGSKYIGEATNNTAEYKAIIHALESAEKFHKGHLELYSDSNLVINQINKKWKINYPHLSKMCNEVYKLSLKYEKVEFFQVGRDNPYIEICDKMCNDKLDEEDYKKL